MKERKTKARKPKIEHDEVLAETGRRSYEVLRLSRVKYAGNPASFIDLRVFQRGWNDLGEEAYHPTKKGVQVKEDQFQRLIGKWTLVPSLLFHRAIIQKAYPALRREEYDTAVFRAFRAVETRVRELSGLPPNLVGITLMRKAFDPTDGPLTDLAAPTAEREAQSHFFAGAIGSYKNPYSHREIEVEFGEAFEMLLVASHLLHILDRRDR